MNKIVKLLLIPLLGITITFGMNTNKAEAANDTDVKDISLGVMHSGALRNDGTIWLWGANYDEQLGNGTDIDSKTPIKIMGNVKKLVLGEDHSAAIKNDNTLWLWGHHDENYNDYVHYTISIPQQVMTNVKDVAVTEDRFAVIKKDNTLWMWGYNDLGQLGLGNKKSKSKAVKIMDNVKKVVINDFNTAVIKTDGSLWIWGCNCSEECRNTSSEYNTKPVKIMENIKDVSLGYHVVAVVKNDNSLWTWGESIRGSLGYSGEHGCTYGPKKIMENVKSVGLNDSPYDNHSIALKKDGTLWGWGENWAGQLGDGTEIDREAPIKIMSGVKDFSVGYAYTAAIKDNNTLWLWGNNYYGQIGDGTKKRKINPVKIVLKYKQTINAKNINKTVSDKARTLKLGASNKGDVSLKYQSDNKSITVNTKGVINIKKNYIGKAMITITSPATKDYNRLSTKSRT